MFELSQEFYFEAAHTLRREIETEPSRRIHGHTYYAKITIKGLPDPITGMVTDLGALRNSLSIVRDQLDHRFLDDVPNLGIPTLENICKFIYLSLREDIKGLSKITVSRQASGDSCSMNCE